MGNMNKELKEKLERLKEEGCILAFDGHPVKYGDGVKEKILHLFMKRLEEVTRGHDLHIVKAKRRVPVTLVSLDKGNFDPARVRATVRDRERKEWVVTLFSLYTEDGVPLSMQV